MRMASFFIASLALHAAMLPLGSLRAPRAAPSLISVIVLSARDESQVLPAGTPAVSGNKAPKIAPKNRVTAPPVAEPPPAMTSQPAAASAPLPKAESAIALAAAVDSPKALLVRGTGGPNNSEGGLTNGTGEGIGGAADRGHGPGTGGNGSSIGQRTEHPPYVRAAYRTTTKPDYPERARRDGKEGRVLLHVLIDEEGRSKVIEVDTSSGSDVLDQAARDAIKKWRFAPARQGDKAVESWVKIPIDFRLSDGRN